MKKWVVSSVLVVIIVLTSIALVFSKVERDRGDVTTEKIKETYIEHLEKLNEYTQKINNNYDGIEESLVKLLEDENNNVEKGTYLYGLSYYYLISGSNDKHIEFGEKAIEEYNKSQEGGLLALEIYSYMINNTIYLNDYNRGLKYCYDALNKIKSLESKFLEDEYLDRFKVIIDCNYINIYSKSGLVKKATPYYENISKYTEDSPVYKKSENLIIYAKLNYNSEMKNYKEMLKYTYKYQEYAEITNNPHKEGLRANLAEALIMNGKPDEAFEHLQASYEFYKDMNTVYEMAFVRNIYGKYYIEKGQYEEAYNYLIKSYDDIRNESGYEHLKMEYIEGIIRANEEGELGNNSIEYISEYIELNKEKDKNNMVIEVFNALEEINKNTYESQIKVYEKSKEELEVSSNENKRLIILLMASAVLLIIFIIQLSQQVIENNKYQKKLEEIVNKDFLTGAFTRYYGMNELEKLALSKKNVSIGLLDIDNFKGINDSYGHTIGDEVLKKLSEKLIHALNEKGKLIRYGGEEFLVIIEDSLENSKVLLDGVRENISKEYFEDGLTVTFSGGIKLWNNESISEIIHDVDKLLYEGKSQGKNRIISN
ncbi:MAG: tetratricopeptide repeat-containing diguanylate cyclase [Clostridium sp.]